jgi:hypothetical protein
MAAKSHYEDIDRVFQQGGAFAYDVAAADDELRKSMREVGYLPGHPVIRDESGVIIEGHRRDRIARELSIQPEVLEIKFGAGDQADIARVRHAVLSNLGSRSFPSEVRARVATHMVKALRWTQKAAADALGVSQASISTDLQKSAADNKPAEQRPEAERKAEREGRRQRAGGGGRKRIADRPAAERKTALRDLFRLQLRSRGNKISEPDHAEHTYGLTSAEIRGIKWELATEAIEAGETRLDLLDIKYEIGRNVAAELFKEHHVPRVAAILAATPRPAAQIEQDAALADEIGMSSSNTYDRLMGNEAHAEVGKLIPGVSEAAVQRWRQASRKAMTTTAERAASTAAKPTEWQPQPIAHMTDFDPLTRADLPAALLEYLSGRRILPSQALDLHTGGPKANHWHDDVQQHWPDSVAASIPAEPIQSTWPDGAHPTVEVTITLKAVRPTSVLKQRGRRSPAAEAKAAADTGAN